MCFDFYGKSGITYDTMEDTLRKLTAWNGFPPTILCLSCQEIINATIWLAGRSRRKKIDDAVVIFSLL